MCAIDPEQTQSKRLINIVKIKILQFFVHNDISNEYHRSKFVLRLSLFFQASFNKLSVTALKHPNSRKSKDKNDGSL